MQRGVAELPHHPQPVGGVAGFQRRVHGQRRAELAQAEPLAQADHVQPMAQQVERALPVERGAQTVLERGLGGGAMGLRDRLPRLGLGLPDPGDEVLDEEPSGAVVPRGGAGLIGPAHGGEAPADHLLEGGLAVDGHGWRGRRPMAASAFTTAGFMVKRLPSLSKSARMPE